MNLPFKIAQRYIISKKSTNAINIIAGVSVVGMLVGTAALLLVLSTFNGFEDLVTSLYDTFNPDLKVSAKMGKTFEADSTKIARIKQLDEVADISLVLEENALVQYNGKQYIFRLKGVDAAYEKVTQIDTAVVEGNFELTNGYMNYAIVGSGVAALLGINVQNQFRKLQVYMPKREQKVSTMRPENAFKQDILVPHGVFFIQQDFDNKYIIVPLKFMLNLLNYENNVSAIEIDIKETANSEAAKAKIAAILGDDFHVKNRFEQDEFLYKVMRTEKWAVYLILTFILIVAAFNMIGSLSMLVIEKKRDIGILKAMGASKGFIKKIFLIEGILLSLIGAGLGVIIAVVLCLAQQHFKILSLGESFLIDAYPVSMRIGDFVLVFVTVSIIATLASVFPAYRAAEQSQLLKED